MFPSLLGCHSDVWYALWGPATPRLRGGPWKPAYITVVLWDFRWGGSHGRAAGRLGGTLGASVGLCQSFAP